MTVPWGENVNQRHNRHMLGRNGRRVNYLVPCTINSLRVAQPMQYQAATRDTRTQERTMKTFLVYGLPEGETARNQ